MGGSPGKIRTTYRIRPTTSRLHCLSFSLLDEEDQNRMSELAERNQDGSLSSDEKTELENFVKAGHLLALLHSKARKTLKTRKVS